MSGLLPSLLAIRKWKIPRSAGEVRLTQGRRLRELVRFARERSPFFRELYSGLPPDPEPDSLPVTDKPMLMARFDETMTDAAIRRSDLDAFVADPSMIGSAFLGKYFVCSTSGTTGRPGLFLHDERGILAVGMLSFFRSILPALGWGGLLRATREGGRTVMLAVDGGHYAAAAGVEWVKKRYPRAGRRRYTLSAMLPLECLAAEMGRIDPSFVVGYPSAMLLLAEEQERKRLAIRPRLLLLAGEPTTADERARLRAAFGATALRCYAASECPALAFDCARGSLHWNSDWYVMEPVDERLRPVPAGTPSHTVLVTSFLNRVQPIIRYNLGDSITVDPRPCACGSPLPVIEVSGRTKDLLVFPGASGGPVRILPLAIATAMEKPEGISRAQAEQTGPDELTLRFETLPGSDRGAVGASLREETDAFLRAQGAGGVRITVSGDLPRLNPRSGKFQEVIGLSR